MKKTLLLTTALAVFSSAHAYEMQYRKGQITPSMEAMLEKAAKDTGVTFDPENMSLIEDRDLATSHYSYYVQTHELIPVDATAIRIWTDKKTGELILGEVDLDEAQQANKEALSAKYRKAKFTKSALQSKQLSAAIQNMVESQVSAHATDGKILGFKSRDKWVKGDLVREVEVRSRRGTHLISISLLRNAVIENSYREFPQSDAPTTSLQANVFPIYEEVEASHEMLKYEVRELKYLNTQIPDGGDAPLAGLGGTRFREDRYMPILAETEVGRVNDIWSENSIRRTVEGLVAKFPVVPNAVESGLLLQGKYATIQLHPDAKTKFPGMNFPVKLSPNHMLAWQKIDGLYEAIPRSGILGKRVTSASELTERIPFRLPKHDPVQYINQGFDEQQVYYAITTLMDSLAEMGFRDPKLSTSPFHAFLYDPDLGMRDNAYYTNDTINFTTYNDDMPNLARDNSTIWHELGHGVMERLMGSFLAFGDSKGGYGGLSEGMADFVAKLVVEHQTNGQNFPGKFDFRIMNNTGLYLTNEFHDEGEAYGGAMADALALAVQDKGRDGLFGFTDLTLEAMRLTRNHPSLTPYKWFEHMLIADEFGSDRRAPGQFRAVLLASLEKRNFSFDKNFKPASMKVMTKFGELTSGSEASREKPTKACDASGTFGYDVQVKLTAGDAEFIKFPAIVKVEFKKGALQGAIAWQGEESNPTVLAINSADEILNIPLRGSMKCEEINQPNGTCKDYAYIQIFNQGGKKPVAKKRFYVAIDPKATCTK